LFPPSNTAPASDPIREQKAHLHLEGENQKV
jgi:hypothetical protein